jgi:16S rRNA (adenine1518-N6/adenine1519-N6)-dimethyltransferase
VSDNLDEYSTNVFIPSQIIQILRTNGLALRKSLGQNLLINRNIVKRTLTFAELKHEDSVLEIGPGLGALTFSLAQHVKELVAIEVDRGIAAYLAQRVETFGCSNATVVHGDFLTHRLNTLPFSKAPTQVLSNFPYSIAIKAMIRIAEELHSVDRITCMVQRELANRITASPGDKVYSFVSVYLQYLMEIQIVEKGVGPQNFFPRPDVESSIVVLRRRKRGASDVTNTVFKDVAKVAFSSRRKRLARNLRQLPLHIGGTEVESLVMELFQNNGIRAEELDLADFIRLAEKLAPHFTISS